MKIWIHEGRKRNSLGKNIRAIASVRLDNGEEYGACQIVQEPLKKAWVNVRKFEKRADGKWITVVMNSSTGMSRYQRRLIQEAVMNEWQKTQR